MKKNLNVIAILALALIFTGCPGNSPSDSIFVPVADIIDVPTQGFIGTAVSLNATVSPANATNKTIVWSVTTAGAGIAAGPISGTSFTPTAAGTVVLIAAIANGTAEGTAFTKVFTIEVTEYNDDNDLVEVEASDLFDQIGIDLPKTINQIADLLVAGGMLQNAEQILSIIVKDASGTSFAMTDEITAATKLWMPSEMAPSPASGYTVTITGIDSQYLNSGYNLEFWLFSPDEQKIASSNEIHLTANASITFKLYYNNEADEALQDDKTYRARFEIHQGSNDSGNYVEGNFWDLNGLTFTNKTVSKTLSDFTPEVFISTEYKILSANVTAVLNLSDVGFVYSEDETVATAALVSGDVVVTSQGKGQAQIYVSDSISKSNAARIDVEVDAAGTITPDITMFDDTNSVWAKVNDPVTITGTVNTPIASSYVAIMLENDSFSPVSAGTDASSWITNLPNGLTAALTYTVGDNHPHNVTLTISGTPATASTAILAITIPDEYTDRGNAVKVTHDVERANFAIAAGG
jgi:hypothetical protein